jgi:hypothetical protein
MTECVQRHDVAPEFSDDPVAKMIADGKADSRRVRIQLAWIIGPMVATTVGLAILAVLT